MINIAIVEDEEKYRKVISEYVSKYAKEHSLEIHVDLFTDGDEIVEGYTCTYDVIFMDVMMQFMDGMAAAEEIRKQDENVIIIFITNMINYAIQGYRVGALDYVLKPINYFSVEKNLDKAIAKLAVADKGQFLSITYPGGMRKLAVKDIRFVENDGHYLVFHTTKDEVRTYMKMKDLEDTLVDYNFYRINKGILVSLRHVDGVEEEDCLVGEDRLPISRRKKKEFLEALNYYFTTMGNQS